MLSIIFIQSGNAAQYYASPWDYNINSSRIKSSNGIFYAYIVLLFNENPHFVNLIQKGSINYKMMLKEGFHVRAYNQYVKNLGRTYQRNIAKRMIHLFLHPQYYKKKHFKYYEKLLLKYDIVLKFSKKTTVSENKITLEYCIFGKKFPLYIKHPFLTNSSVIHNIQPYIYYDEFTTSNSTFYYDMIYINTEEVSNDAVIARRVINKKSVNTMFFVGSKVTEDIKYCLVKSFYDKKDFSKRIWRMFVVHELTHKIINNKYKNFDHVTGEELSLVSTIYDNPYLGLSVMYSYLNYNSINPHRIAANKIIRSFANQKKDMSLMKKPDNIKFLKYNELKTMAKFHFKKITGNIK